MSAMLPNKATPTQQPQEDKVNIGYRGTETYRRRLQMEALQRGVKVQTLIDTAVAYYLVRKPAPSLQEDPCAAKG